MAGRLGLGVVLVTNGSRPVRPPPCPSCGWCGREGARTRRMTGIAEAARLVDICLTADIPLARAASPAGLRALLQGRAWTTDNIGSALAGREVARHLREMGMAGGGPAPMTAADRSRLLNALDAMAQAALRRARERG